ncbi:unnamed protein product [Parajaminaea phylloscopi]
MDADVRSPRDLEKGPSGPAPSHDPASDSGSFDLQTHLRYMGQKAEDHGVEFRQMGVAWKDLEVTGVGSGFALQTTVGSLATEPLRAAQTISGLMHPPIKHILQGLDGCVKPGEMLLVLGRPGSGCTTFLKTIASYRKGFRAINGDILYQGFDYRQVEGPLRGDVIYVPEDDVHFATLTVSQTLDFAAATRAPQRKRRMDLEQAHASRESYIELTKTVIAKILGLTHTFNTVVGNAIIRGVSGGERKRISIAEGLATRARVTCLDNSSRGLDSSTALDFIRSLRTATDVGGLTTLCSLYQAGEGMATLFDKVLILNEGRMVYFGPYDEAFDYFHSMGYEPQPRQTTADFLVACTDAVGRRVREGYQSRVPLTPDAQAQYFVQSAQGQRNREEVDGHMAEMKKMYDEDERRRYQMLANQEKAKRVPQKSPFLISWFQMIRLCIKRRAQIMWGDRLTTAIITFAAVFQALIIGSTFYSIPNTTAGFFSRGGTLFFLILYQSFMAAAEIPNSYSQRPIVIRQKHFAMASPSADALANTLLDIPVRLISMTAFLIIIYFMVGLSTTLASQFFVLYGTVALTTFVMVATFRALAAIFRAESTATLCSGLMIIATALYAGYVINRPSMVVWWKWISYAQPIAYAFEILVANEFRTLQVPCAQLIPAGPAYAAVDAANRVCPVVGARPGQTIINGLEYIQFAYGYSWSNRDRNAGILIAFFVFSVTVYAIASEFQSDPSAAGGIMVYKRDSAPKEVRQAAKAHGDLEAGKSAVPTPDSASVDQDAAVSGIETSNEIFSWHNIDYDVVVKKETRRLLSDVSGFVKPGSLVALMGASGAGKTTLLNVLAHRAGTGVVTGEMKLSGRHLPRSFQASTGYCQQQDVHLATTSVREALRFSAVLRQPAETPLQEKYDYVEKVIQMLEMESFAEAIVGDVGIGLNVEQRKRLTIAVELAAKPKLLLFLDEPTSGLDGQAAWSIVRFLRKLADAGQAILCTIHQPSGELFNVFDRLLLLQKGGKMVYFGDIGERSTKVAGYFERLSGRPCNDGDNVAEYMLDVIGAGATNSSKEDWHQLFKESELYAQLQRDLDEILRTERAPLSAEDEARGQREYAASAWTQFTVVLRRTWLHYWRDPVYLGSKIGLCVIAGLFIGSSFWNQGSLTSVASLQNKLFAIFMALVLSTSLAQQMQPLFIAFRELYEARERPSKLYSWLILPLTFILVEIPWNILAGTLFWLPWFFMIRFNPGSSSRAALSWAYICVFFEIYWSTFAAAIATIAPSPMLASILFSTLFSFVIVFCGVVQVPALMPYFWRSWMTVLTPFTYLLEALLGNTLGDLPVRCSAAEFNTVIPPAGQDCRTYLGQFSSTLQEAPVGQGYYQQNGDGSCSYCQYREGSTFLTSLSAPPLYFSVDHRFRNIGIIIAYCAFNTALLLGFCYLRFREPKAKKQVQNSPAARSDNHSTDMAKDQAADTAVASVSSETTTGLRGETSHTEKPGAGAKLPAADLGLPPTVGNAQQ